MRDLSWKGYMDPFVPPIQNPHSALVPIYPLRVRVYASNLFRRADSFKYLSPAFTLECMARISDNWFQISHSYILYSTYIKYSLQKNEVFQIWIIFLDRNWRVKPSKGFIHPRQAF